MRARDAKRPESLLFPDSTPPGLNHVVLTGKVRGEPRRAEGPDGDPVFVAEIEFPVADPRDPRRLRTYARYLVEVPEGVGEGEELLLARPLLVAGQLTKRLALHGCARQQGTILASLLKVGPAPEEER